MSKKITRKTFFKLILTNGVILTTASPLELLAENNPPQSPAPYFPNMHFKTNEEMFPISWKSPAINPKAESLSKNKITKTQKIIKDELDKYPENVLKNLHDIYALDSLTFYGIPYGGTSSTNKIYLTNGSDWYMRHALHHEFSSILLKKYPDYFDKKSWKQNNPSDFKYSGDGREFIKEKKHYTPKMNQLYNKGFLNDYAQSSIENDCNEFAGKMFCNDGEFWRIIKRFNRLKGKFEIMLQFYQSLDKKLDINYFKKISRS